MRRLGSESAFRHIVRQSRQDDASLVASYKSPLQLDIQTCASAASKTATYMTAADFSAALRTGTINSSASPASGAPTQSPPRRCRGFCTAPERPPPAAPHKGPPAGKGWCERFRAAAVGPGASLVRWRLRGGVLLRLGMKSLSYGLPRALGLFYGPSGREGTGTTPRRCSVTALPLTYFPRRHN